MIIGIRREDKNQWERRVPLVPDDLAELATHGLRFRVQPSPNRTFTDDDYRAVGIEVAEDLDPCDLVLAVKEIPIPLLQAGRAYVYFSHVIKGQAYNMPMLRHLLEQGCSLVDYEKICGPDGGRLIYFSLHAGYAGTIETLWALGQRLRGLGIETPLSEIKQTYEYASLDDAKEHLGAVGERLADAMPPNLRPLVIGVAGYGNVARGCREILDVLPCEWITPQDLAGPSRLDPTAPPICCVEFREEDLARHAEDGPFDLLEYFHHPERYEPAFEPYLDHLDVLLNAIYWEPRYPRLVTRAWAQANPEPRLQVIGDISCDIDGAVELTRLATMPDQPSYSCDPVTGDVTYGVHGRAPVIMSVDNLPCELPRESSEHFSSVLRTLVPPLAACDWSRPFAELDLPAELKDALVVHKGSLTEGYRYLQQYLDA